MRDPARPGACRIYIARAVDGVAEEHVAWPLQRASQNFKEPDFALVDPMLGRPSRPPGGSAILVKDQIELLLTCDLLLVDMSIPDRLYIGCVAEIVYANLHDIRVIVYLGSVEVQGRPWLDYHADFISGDWDAVVDAVHGSPNRVG